MTYCRYADDFVVGIIGSQADAIALKTWLTDYLKTELLLELSTDKTLITNAQEADTVPGIRHQALEGRTQTKISHRTLPAL